MIKEFTLIGHAFQTIDGVCLLKVSEDSIRVGRMKHVMLAKAAGDDLTRYKLLFATGQRIRMGRATDRNLTITDLVNVWRFSFIS